MSHRSRAVLTTLRRRLLPNCRVLFIAALALFFTASIAWYHRISVEHDYVQSLSNANPQVPELNEGEESPDGNNNNGDEDVADDPGAQKDYRRLEHVVQFCSWKDEPVKDAPAHFNTFDLYKTKIAQISATGNPILVPPRKSPEGNATKTQKLRVFVVPFTHVDPGWLRTFDSYTNDTNKILDNMHAFMTKNPAMRFIWAEFVFFERWWETQNETVREDVKKLVTEGRLELASGSWVMTDEANAFFPVSVDNIVEGHQYLDEHFGVLPKTIWSNDPFGYSNSVPFLFSKTGIRRNVINRIHHGIKNVLQRQHGIPFSWRQYFDTDGTNDVLTQVLPYTHYDILNSCGPDPGKCCQFDFKRMTHWGCPSSKPVPITAQNVADKSQMLLGQLEAMSKMYEAPVILMMHGDDFRYDMIEEWHQQHDNFLPLFKHINQGSRAEISFGTFTDYFDALEKYYSEHDFEPPTLTGDFFPYQCALGDYWTGYFTTRPFYKRQGRHLHWLIRAADLLTAEARTKLSEESRVAVEDQLRDARRTLALFQHHDAITGTSKKSVMADYSRLLHEAANSTRKVLATAASALSGLDTKMDEEGAEENSMVMQKIIRIREGQEFVVSVFNSLPYPQEDVISLRVDSSDVLVLGEKTIQAQIEPFVLNGKVDADSFLLSFVAQLPALSTVRFLLRGETNENTVLASVVAPSAQIRNWQRSRFGQFPREFVIEKSDGPETFRLKGAQISTKNDPLTGLITEVATEDVRYAVNNTFVAYQNVNGGAYLMRAGDDAKIFVKGDLPRFLVRGPVQQSIHVFHECLYQRVGVKNVPGAIGAQLGMTIRVDITKQRNTELMMRLDTDFQKARAFSDSVGLQLLRRESHGALNTPANFYPMPSSAVLETDKQRLTVASNVEHGVHFLKDNGVEIALDRMLNQDDGKGLGYGEDSLPTDLRPVEMRFAILFEEIVPPEKETVHYSAHTTGGQLAVQRTIYPPVVFVSPAPKGYKVPTNEVLLPPFPCDFQLLTLRKINGDAQLLVLFRHAVICSTTPVACGENLQEPLVALLKKLGFTRAQPTTLNGLSKIGGPLSVGGFPDFEVNKFDFFSLVLR